MTFVLGYDSSPASAAALETVIGLARAFSEPLVVVCGVAPPGGMGEEYRSHEAAVLELARGAVAAAVDRAREAGVEASAELVDARAADAIIEAGDRHDARMLVVGSNQHGPLMAAIVGATSHRVLHQATRPVLVVKA